MRRGPWTRIGLPYRDELPAIGVSRLRASGAISPDDVSTVIAFGEVRREVRLAHRRFPNGGSWSFFLCPKCGRRVRTLRLHDGQVCCRRCDGLVTRRDMLWRRPEGYEGSIARLEAQLYGGPVRLKPRTGRTLDRREELEMALRSKLVKVRRMRLEGAPRG